MTFVAVLIGAVVFEAKTGYVRYYLDPAAMEFIASTTSSTMDSIGGWTKELITSFMESIARKFQDDGDGSTDDDREF